MHYLSIEQVLEIHRRVILQSGGSPGLRDRGALHASVSQPLQTFSGVALYPTLADRAAALGYFLIANHPFVDGNKRVGHAAMETLLILNGSEVAASLEEQETMILAVASGNVTREEFTRWLADHLTTVE